MEIGKKIKELRTAKGITQEALAAELNVSAQAVSKWECGVSTPDIQLLPAIAIYFGVTLDALFCLTDDDELDRIQNMIWDSRMLPQGQLEQAERFLNGRIDAGYRPGRCWCLLAQLHNHQARQHQELAAEYARRSLALCPGKRTPTTSWQRPWAESLPTGMPTTTTGSFSSIRTLSERTRTIPGGICG